MQIKLSKDIIIDEITFSDIGNKVLQGICNVGDYTFITAYDDTGSNSVIYILDKDYKCIKEVTLYNNSHVGGICFDDINHLFWITDKDGFIVAYRYQDIIDGIGEVFDKVYVGDGLINYRGKISAAYISYNSGKLYVGNFSLNGKGILKEYKTHKNGSIDLGSVNVIKFIDKVQGITFYDDWLIVSTSFGKNNNSELKIFKYDNLCDCYCDRNFISIVMPPMMEQICFKKDYLITLYEVNAKKFNVLFTGNSDVVILDFNKIKKN